MNSSLQIFGKKLNFNQLFLPFMILYKILLNRVIELNVVSFISVPRKFQFVNPDKGNFFLSYELKLSFFHLEKVHF